MTYANFRDRIRARLNQAPDGLTWKALKADLDLPYERPCPEWIKRLEREIGLTRTLGEEGRALIWRTETK